MTWSRHYNSAPQNGKQHWRIILNILKYREISWATFFHILHCWCKKTSETCQRCFAFFLYIINPKKYYVPSVLELELCMDWKCTWCFVAMNFGFIFTYVHFLKAFCYKETIKTCLLPFLSNLYCTSIRRPLFKVPRVAA